jgi:hypothetical protein
MKALIRAQNYLRAAIKKGYYSPRLFEEMSAKELIEFVKKEKKKKKEKKGGFNVSLS